MDWFVPPEATSTHSLYILTAVLAYLLTAVSKGGFGGVGVLAVPLMMLVAPAEFVLGMWLPLLLLCDIFTIRNYPRQWALRPILLLTPWMLGGLVLGWLLLRHLTEQEGAEQVVKILVGAISLGFAVLEVGRSIWSRRSVNRERSPWKPGWLSTAPFGLMGGVSTVLAHSAGPITSIYLLAQRMDKRCFAGTSGRYYFVFNALKIPIYVLPAFGLGYITLETLKLSLWLVPIAPLGVWFGARLNRWLPAVAFGRVVYALLAISGIYLIWSNIGRR